MQRPSVCNAAESLLVHKDVAMDFLPDVIDALQKSNVEVLGCDRTQALGDNVALATDEDYNTEFHDYKISIKIVDDLEEAITHVNKYGTMHTEAIVSKDQQAIDKFSLEVDASTIMVNASTRFTDGFVFGFGAEIGISTQKMHARGPMGLKELTSYKYVVVGNGQIRG